MNQTASIYHKLFSRPPLRRIIHSNVIMDPTRCIVWAPTENIHHLLQGNLISQKNTNVNIIQAQTQFKTYKKKQDMGKPRLIYYFVIWEVDIPQQSKKYIFVTESYSILVYNILLRNGCGISNFSVVFESRVLLSTEGCLWLTPQHLFISLTNLILKFEPNSHRFWQICENLAQIPQILSGDFG